MASIIRIGNKWRAQVRRKGVKPTTKTFSAKAAAIHWAHALEAAIESGQAVHDPASATVGMVIERYRDLRESSGRPVQDTSNEWYILRRLQDGLGDLLVARLDTDDLIAFCQYRKKEGAGAATVNMDISKLSTVLRHAGSAMRLRIPDIVGLARPTLHHLDLIGSGGQRTRRPTDDELTRLFAWFAENRARMGPPMEDIVRLAILLGLRRGEIFRVLWADLDTQQKLLLVRDRKDPRKKRGNDQWVPLIGDALDIIQRQPRVKDRIFPYHPQTVSKYFKRACDALAIPDLHLHDCRHEAASALIEAGWTPHETKMVTGHKQSRQLDRYVNLSPAELVDKPARKKPSTQ